MADSGFNIDDLQIKIGINASEAAAGLRDLAKGLRSTASECSHAAKPIKEVAKSAKDIGTSTSAASDSVEKLEDSAKTATHSLRDIAKGLSKTGEEAKKSAHGGLSAFFASVKRIAMYRMIRSAIKAITNAFREGLDMFVTWDRERNNMQAGAAKTIDELKAKYAELKGSIGAAIAPIIQSLQPVIEWVVDALIKVFDLIQQIVRALRGESEWYKAIYVDAKGTTAEAKELKRVLFGFDELNVLPSLSGSGGSSDGGHIEYVKKAIPEWMQLLKPIGAAALGITGIVTAVKGLSKALRGLKNLLSPISSLFERLFGTKNEKRKIDITTNTKPVEELSDALDLALGIYVKFDKYVKQNIIKILYDKKELDLSDYRKELDSTVKYAVENPVAIKLDVPTLDLNPIKEVVDETNTWLGKNPLVVKMSLYSKDFSKALTELLEAVGKTLEKTPLEVIAVLNGKGLNDALANMLRSMQQTLNNNPLSIPLKLDDDITGRGNPSSIYNNVVNSFDPSKYSNYQAVGGGGHRGTGGNINGGGTSGFVGSGGTGSESLWDKIKRILGFANGGVPNVGTLFYAGEAGAEVVANMGHSTGVMNVSQMQDAVANGNIEVVNAVYAMANMVVNAVNAKDTNVYLDAQKVGQSVSQYQLNYARAYGG